MLPVGRCDSDVKNIRYLAVERIGNCLFFFIKYYAFDDLAYLLMIAFCDFLDCDIHYCYKLLCGLLLLRFAICTI